MYLLSVRKQLTVKVDVRCVLIEVTPEARLQNGVTQTQRNVTQLAIFSPLQLGYTSLDVYDQHFAISLALFPR